MPHRSLYVRAPNGSIELLTPRTLLNADTNVFDKAFNVNTVASPVEFDDWMRWDDVPAPDLDASTLQRPATIMTDLSSPEGWAVDVESLDAELTPTFDGFAFEDAPFDLDENHPQAMASHQAGSLRTLAPTRINRTYDTRRQFRGYTSLTQQQEQDLSAIAMPPQTTSTFTQPTTEQQLPPHAVISPARSISPSPTASPSPAPPPRTRKPKSKKRKAPAAAKEDDLPTSLCQSRKRGHNAIEKRYRTNLNDKISCLRAGIPSLRRHNSAGSINGAGGGDEAEDSDAEGNGRTKYGKAAILSRALEYIKHLERTTERLGGEVGVLRGRVEAFERLKESGSLGGRVFAGGIVVGEGETLLSIQDEFKQIKQEHKPILAAQTSRLRQSKAKNG